MRTRRWRRVLFFFVLPLIVASCQSYLLFDPADDARDLVRRSGWREVRFDVGAFSLVGFHKPLSGSTAPLDVYIEGDGFAWRTSTQPSADPTPLNPVALHMALNDPAANVLYIARPCQYLRRSPYKGCDVRFWTMSRFAEDVVAATNLAISRFEARSGATRLRLFGYSGGGAIAALVAARRDDVDLLVTVAGNLDHRAWTDYHRVSPLSGSLNPVDFGKRLRDIPQVNLIGSDDKIMPEEISRSYMRALGPNSAAKFITIPGYDHQCCWGEKWGKLLGLINKMRY